jgi:hypothetical protein
VRLRLDHHLLELGAREAGGAVHHHLQGDAVVWPAAPQLQIEDGAALVHGARGRGHGVAHQRPENGVDEFVGRVGKDGGVGDKGYNWLLFLNYTIDKNWSSAFRVSGEKLSNGGAEFTKLTVCPTYKINDNFSVRAELSYYDYKKTAADSATFFAVQSIFKF